MADTATTDNAAGEMLDAIADQREAEEAARAECERTIADEHRRSVELWRRAYDDLDMSYVEIGQRIGVTRAYVRGEVLKLKAGQL